MSKEARQAAVAAINERPDADDILHAHTQFVDTHEVWGEFDLITESKPPVQ